MERRNGKDPSVEEAAQVLSSLGSWFRPGGFAGQNEIDLGRMKISSLMNKPTSPKTEYMDSPSTTSDATVAEDTFACNDRVLLCDKFYLRGSGSSSSTATSCNTFQSLSSYEYTNGWEGNRDRIQPIHSFLKDVQRHYGCNDTESSLGAVKLPQTHSTEYYRQANQPILPSNYSPNLPAPELTPKLEHISPATSSHSINTVSSPQTSCKQLPQKVKRFKTVPERIHQIKHSYFAKDIEDEIPELDHIPRLLYKIRTDVRKQFKTVGTKDIQRHLWDVKLLALFEGKLVHKETGEVLDPTFREDVIEGRLVRWRDAQARIKVAWRQTSLYQPELRPRKRSKIC